jgi:hypothetical protein
MYYQSEYLCRGTLIISILYITLVPVAWLRSLFRMLLPVVLFDMTIALIMRAMLTVTRLLRATVARIADATSAECEVDLLSTLQLFIVV